MQRQQGQGRGHGTWQGGDAGRDPLASPGWERVYDCTGEGTGGRRRRAVVALLGLQSRKRPCTLDGRESSYSNSSRTRRRGAGLPAQGGRGMWGWGLQGLRG